MGYISTLSGELVIEPPLKWSEYRDSSWIQANATDLCVKLDEHTDTRETDEGTVIARTARAVVPRYSEGKMHNLAADLRTVAKTWGDTHTFSGYLIRDGEESGDVERYWIDGTTVKSEKAWLFWPDGTEVEL